MFKGKLVFPSVAAICAAASLCVATAPAGEGQAQAAITSDTRYDGVWIVDASISSPFCPRRERRLFLALTGGDVVKVAGVTDPPPRAVGHVDAGGGVAMSLSALGYIATIHGRLDGRAGSGKWSSNSSLCSGGAWRAHKAN